MSLNSVLHDPTWIKFNGAVLFGSCGLLVLAALRVKFVRARKRNIYKPSVLLAETYGPDDGDEIVSPIRAVNPVTWYRGPSCRKFMSAALGMICFAISVSAYLYALQNFIILTNWEDGQSRDFIGDHVGAIVCYKKALRADPTLRHTHLLMGIALLKSNHVRSAIPEFKAASNGESSDPESAAMLGDSYQILDMPAEAIEAYKQAAAIAPGDPSYYLCIGGCLEKLHHPDNCVRRLPLCRSSQGVGPIGAR